MSLRASWWRRSLELGWTLPDDWWVPAVDAVAQAVQHGEELGPPCLRLGDARARAGVGIGEALLDLGALFRVLNAGDRAGDPPLAAVRSLAEGWADASLLTLSQAHCEDALTGLVTLPYLRTRLREIYREADVGGCAPSVTHRLLLIDLRPSIDPWQRIAQAITVGHDLRMVFRGGETLTLVGTGRAAVLSLAHPGLAAQVDGLRSFIEAGARLWVRRLPDDIDEAMDLLDDLAAH